MVMHRIESIVTTEKKNLKKKKYIETYSRTNLLQVHVVLSLKIDFKLKFKNMK